MARVPRSATDLDAYPSVQVGYDERADIAAVLDNLFDGEAVDRVYRGLAPGIQLLAVTNRRLMMVESQSVEGRLALTSVPFARVTSVSFLAERGEPLDFASTIGIRVLATVFELHCVGPDEAREAHDLISWNLTH
jgi:hypothetical protein